MISRTHSGRTSDDDGTAPAVVRMTSAASAASVMLSSWFVVDYANSAAIMSCCGPGCWSSTLVEDPQVLPAAVAGSVVSGQPSTTDGNSDSQFCSAEPAWRAGKVVRKSERWL